MSEDHANHHPPEASSGEDLRVSPPGSARSDYEPRIYPSYAAPEDEPPAEDRFQFSVVELLGLMAGLAVVLGILGCIPGALSIQVVAGLSGLGLLVSLVVLAVVQPSRPIIRVAWWVLLALYVLASAAALVRGVF